VPGPINSPASAGCHRLIRDYDATLITNPDEVVELLGGAGGGSGGGAGHGSKSEVASPIELRPPSAEETRLLDALSFSAPRQSADIAARAGLSERERGWVKLRPKNPQAPPPSLSR
jgi:DNA processing protein